MKWVETRISYTAADPETAADLISDIFDGFGLQGVAVESPEADAGLDRAEEARSLPSEYAVTGYLPKDTHLAERCRILERRLSDFQHGGILNYSITYTDIDEQDWAHAWKAHFHPVEVTDRIVIKPSWREYEPRPDQMVIELDPGMAFGTGTHPTTAMCIRLIEAYLRPGDAFLDIGTGSGILMLAADKLGAASVTGIDNDEVAVEVAQNNLLKNRVPPDRFRVYTSHLAEPAGGFYDLVCANILSEIIVELIPDIRRVLKPAGILICSGIIEAKKEMVTGGLAANGFGIRDMTAEDEWIAIAATLSGSF